MAVKMRLTRLGDKKTPFYRVVVADSKVARDAKYIDLVGTYNPLTNPEEIKIDAEKAKKWLANGAQPTETVKALLNKAGITENAKKSK
jgi:small subunit ribosomal protein S16